MNAPVELCEPGCSYCAASARVWAELLRKGPGFREHYERWNRPELAIAPRPLRWVSFEQIKADAARRRFGRMP